MGTRTTELIRAAESGPQNETSINTAERDFPMEDDARNAFTELRAKLLDLSSWSEKSGLSEYALFDDEGNEFRDGVIEQGRFIRILLHGSGKYDWVRVERIHETDDELVISVRPTFDPTARPRRTDVVSHFFASTAINNFCLAREGSTLRMCVIGIGEKQNTSDTGGIVESARNAAVANLGSYLGVQSAEWKKFCNSFLDSVADGRRSD